MGTDPWFALRALGLSILILLTAGIPTLVLAQPEQLEWKSVPSETGHSPILFLWGIITAATASRLYSVLYKDRDEIDPADLASMPEEGTPLGGSLWGWLRVITEDKHFNLKKLKEKVHNQDRITPNKDFLINASIRDSLVRQLGQIILRLEELETMHEGHLDTIESVSEKLRDLMALPDEETLENMLKHTEELLKFAKGIKREFNSWFPEETNTTLDNVIKKLEDHFAAGAALQTENDELHQEIVNKNKSLQALMNDVGKWETLALLFPGTAATWKAVSNKIRELMDKTDLSPLVHLFKNPPADLTPAGLAKEFRLGLDNLEKAVQSTCPNEKLSDYSDMEDFIYKTQDFAKRSTKYWKHMSGVTSTTTNVTETDADNLRNLISPKYFPTSGPLNYDQLLAAFAQLNKERLDAITSGKQPMPSGSGCRHPEEAAQALHQDPNAVSWADSLDEMTRLYDLAQQGNPPVGGDDKLFRASEVPEFKERKEYWSFRSSLNRFISGVIVRDQDRLLALNRILSRFTGKEVSDAANRWNVTNLAATAFTWAEAYTAFLKELDRRFLSPDFATQQEIRFRSLRVKDLEPQDFINEFETRVRTLEEALELAEMTPIENGEIMRQLMSVLPGDIRSKIKDQFRKPEEEDFFTISPDIIRWWININSAKPRDQRQRRSSGGSKAADASNTRPSGNTPPRPQSHPTWGICNKPCWDSETIVPNGYRGPYMGIQRGRDNICPRCRRGKNEHGGHPDGCQHYGAHHWHDKPASRSADPSGNDTGDN